MTSCIFFSISLFFVLDVIWDRLGYEKPSSGSGLQSFHDGLVMFYDLEPKFYEIWFFIFLTKNVQKLAKT